MNTSPKRIAIIADWLIDFGGAELVISHLLEMYPNADIYTSVCYMDHPMLKGHKVYTSWIQNIPFLNRKHKLAGILRPYAFRSFDLSGYDLILCSSSAESKQVALGKWGKKSHTKIIVYCHTPIRYYWSHAKEYENMMEFGWLNPIIKRVFRIMKGWLQRLDYQAAQKVDYFIANSNTTAQRIQKYYDRESYVIYPGVDTPVQSPDDSADKKSEAKNVFYICVGRCIPYKKFDLLVEAFNKNGKRLILCTATDTQLYRELKKQSKPNIEWKFRVSNTEKNHLISKAAAFLFPPEEDFGLAPVEAMILGTPVIAYGKGGATESVIEGKTGVFFDAQTPESLNETIEKFEIMQWNRETIQERGKEFAKEIFQKNISTFVEQHMR